jgi:RNA polymerase sigma-B factor
MERDEEQVREQFRTYRQTADVSLRDELIEQHIGLARHCARRFADRGEPLDDLSQVAMVGLMKAVERYDPDAGTPFAGFAVPTILGELRRYFRDATWAVHVPRKAKDLHVRLSPAVEALQHRLGRSPTPAELAEELRVSIDDVLEASEASAAYRPHTLDGPPTERGGGLAERLASTHGGHENVEAQVLLAQVMEGLPERERTILELRFMEELSQAEIAARVGISQMHVSRLLRRTLAAMKDVLVAGSA